MKHREKLKIARRMADTDKSLWWIDSKGHRHRKKGFGVFNGEKWDERKKNKATRVKNLIVSASWRKKNTYEDK